MTKKADKKTDNGGNRRSRVRIENFKEMQFVMNNLSDDDLALIDQQDFDYARYAEFLEKCIDNGLDVKFTWDTYSECYQCSASGNYQGYHNAGFAVSARSEELLDAQKILWAKVDWLAGFDLPAMAEEKRPRRKRG